MQGLEAALNGFQPGILFFTTETLPAPFEGEGGVIVGKALDVTEPTPGAWFCGGGSGAAAADAVVLLEPAIPVDGRSHLGWDVRGFLTVDDPAGFHGLP